jgi:DNA topoisomerase IA
MPVVEGIKKVYSENFIELMDYKFTSNLEEKLDDVANDKIIWNVLLKDFYNEFHPIVNKLQNVKYNNDDNIVIVSACPEGIPIHPSD